MNIKLELLKGSIHGIIDTGDVAVTLIVAKTEKLLDMEKFKSWRIRNVTKINSYHKIYKLLLIGVFLWQKF